MPNIGIDRNTDSETEEFASTRKECEKIRKHMIMSDVSVDDLLAGSDSSMEVSLVKSNTEIKYKEIIHQQQEEIKASKSKIGALKEALKKKSRCWSGSGPHDNFLTKSLTTFDFLSKPKNISFSTLYPYFFKITAEHSKL